MTFVEPVLTGMVIRTVDVCSAGEKRCLGRSRAHVNAWSQHAFARPSRAVASNLTACGASLPTRPLRSPVCRQLFDVARLRRRLDAHSTTGEVNDIGRGQLKPASDHARRLERERPELIGHRRTKLQAAVGDDHGKHGHGRSANCTADDDAHMLHPTSPSPLVVHLLPTVDVGVEQGFYVPP